MAGRDKYMEWFSKGHLVQAKYEEYLPYAIAFGLTKTWSDVGAKVVQSTPEWITLPESVTFDPVQFHASFLDAVNFIARHEIGSYREPKADSWWESTGGDSSGGAWGGGSGFGGGFSGGGFGGGGGGSW